MRILLNFAVMSLASSACAEPEPVATGSKRKQPVPATSPSTPVPTGNPTATTGDAANGALFLSSRCEGCHTPGGGGLGHDLTKADATDALIEKSKVVASHSASLIEAMSQNKADIIAALQKK